jgi:hypothetical protein
MCGNGLGQDSLVICALVQLDLDSRVVDSVLVAQKRLHLAYHR